MADSVAMSRRIHHPVFPLLPGALFVVLLVALGLAGCSSPQRRIEKNLALFESLPAEQQELIKQGKVGLGFTPEMVLLAVGEPDRKWLRTDETGDSEAWSYTTYAGPGGMMLYSGWYHSYYSAWYPYYTSYGPRVDREYFRVSFKDGKVVSVTQDVR
ncbi:hypothetical protein OpiT1DRAFT_04584 [Opitutaceae bacterium TAV1]|nr:hypothetical protein OpiT1DRAFT_04584 [Opitutaceae bacterium TAV1]